MYYCAPLFAWVLGITHRSLCLYKHFTAWVIALAPVSLSLMGWLLLYFCEASISMHMIWTVSARCCYRAIEMRKEGPRAGRISLADLFSYPSRTPLTMLSECHPYTSCSGFSVSKICSTAQNGMYYKNGTLDSVTCVTNKICVPITVRLGRQ